MNLIELSINPKLRKRRANKMSSRSGRQHKPTSKFLHFYSEELGSPKRDNRFAASKKKAAAGEPSPPKRDKRFAASKKKADAVGKKTVPAKKAVTKKKVVLAKPLPGNELTRSLALRKTVTGPTKPNMVPVNTSSPQKRSPVSPEIRRSGRKQKPNRRLKEFVHTPIVQSKDNNSFNGFERGPDDILSPIRSAKLKTARVEIESLPNYYQPKKEYRYKPENYETSSEGSDKSTSPVNSKSRGIKRNKKSGSKSVAAVSPMVREDVITPSFKNDKDLSVRLIDCFEELTNDLALHHPTSSQVNKDSCSSPSKRGIKRHFKDVPSEVPLNKQPKLGPPVVRSLTKTKKTTNKAKSSQPPTTDSTNKKEKIQPLKVQTRHSTTQQNISPICSDTTESVEAGSSSDDDIYVTQHLIVSEPPKKDIRETLKKFLIMGSKVANAISETLKHNEEALLSQSSAFEKKCLSLVHALAKQGSDLEEEDMEKVLKLLDEEQEERKAYRHTFLESLRVSHLTNMALYSQMLRLLKSL